MIFVSVGTFIKGFDQLVAAMDRICAQTGFAAFAQIGNSSVVPQHMAYARFLTSQEMETALRRAQLVVCHGGLGIIGDAMRAQRLIIAVPRHDSENSFKNPANNQLATAHRLRDLYGIAVCSELDDLPDLVSRCIASSTGINHYQLHSNIPLLIRGFLEQTS